MAHPHVDDLANFLVVPHVLPSGAHYWFDTFICSRHGNFRFDRLPKWVICSCLPLNSHLDNCLPQFLRNIAVNYLGDTAGLYKLPLRRVTRSCLGRHQAGDGCIHASAGPKWHLLAVRKSLSPSLSRQLVGKLGELGKLPGRSKSLGKHFVSLLLFEQWIDVSCMRIMKHSVAMRECV